MPNVSRPDLLPFALPARIGLPYHGLITGGVLDLGGGLTKALGVTPAGESCWIAKNPHRAHPIIATPDDVAAGREWREYALWNWSTLGGYLGVTQLTDCDYLYSDKNATWGIKIETSRSNLAKQTTVSVSLINLVGRFVGHGPPLTKSSSTLLDTLTFDDLDEDGDPLNPAGITSGWKYMASPTPDGSACYINCYYPRSGIGLPRVRKVYAVVKATLSGDGSLAQATLGNGISCALTLEKQLPDLYSYEYTPVDSGSYPTECIAIAIDTSKTVSVTDPAGNVFSENYTESTAVEQYDFFYAFDTTGGTLVWSHVVATTVDISHGYDVGAVLPAAFSMTKDTIVSETHTIACNGVPVVTSSGSGTSVECAYAGVMPDVDEDELPQSFSICLTNDYCDSGPGAGVGLDNWDQVWLGQAVFSVGFSWVGAASQFHVISTYNDSVAFGATDPTSYNFSFQPMTRQWGQHETELVCWV